MRAHHFGEKNLHRKNTFCILRPFLMVPRKTKNEKRENLLGPDWLKGIRFSFFERTKSCTSWQYENEKRKSKYSGTVRTRTRTNTNPNGTEANAAGRSGNARALRKQYKCGMIQEGERHWPNSSEKFQKARNLWVLRTPQNMYNRIIQ